MKKFNAFLLLMCTLLWGFSTNVLAQDEKPDVFDVSEYFENLDFNDTSVATGNLYMCAGWTMVASMYQLTDDHSSKGPEQEKWDEYTGQGNANWLGGSPAGDGSAFVFISGTPPEDDSAKDLEYGTGGWKLVRQTSKKKMPAGYYTITCTYGCTKAREWDVKSETSEPADWTPSFALFVEDEEYKVYKDAYFEWTGNPNTNWNIGTWDNTHDSYDYSYAKTTSISIDMQHSGYLEIGFITCGTDQTTVAIDNIEIEADLYSYDYSGELSDNIIDTYFDNADLNSGNEMNVPDAWTLYTNNDNGNGVSQWIWALTTEYSMNDPLVDGRFLLIVPSDDGEKEVPVGTKMVAQTSKTQLPAGTYHLEVAMGSNVDAEKESNFELFGLYAQIVESADASATENGLVTIAKTIYSESEPNAEWDAEIVALDFSLTVASYVEIGVMTTEEFKPSEHSPRLFFDNFVLVGAKEVIAITDAQYATYYCEHEYLLPSTVWAATTVKDTYQTDAEAGSTMGHLVLDWEFAPGDLIPSGTALLVYGPEGTHYGEITKPYYPVEYSDTDIKQLISENILFGSMFETTTYVPESSNLYEANTEYYYYQFSYGPKNSQYEDKLGFYWLIDGRDSEGKQTASGGPFTSEAHRCWMALPQSEVDYDGGSQVCGFTFYGPDDTDSDGDNDTSSITSVESATPTAEGIYTIQGVRVSDMSQKGVYIVDGRKILVK